MGKKALFDSLLGQFEDEGNVCNRAVVQLDRSSLLSEGFLNSALIMDDFKVEGEVPVVMERYTIERMVGDIALIFFSRNRIEITV